MFRMAKRKEEEVAPTTQLYVWFSGFIKVHAETTLVLGLRQEATATQSSKILWQDAQCVVKGQSEGIGCSKSVCLHVWMYVYVCTETNLTRTLNGSSYSNTTPNWKVVEEETQEGHGGEHWFHMCIFSPACSLLSSRLPYQRASSERQPLILRIKINKKKISYEIFRI